MNEIRIGLAVVLLALGLATTAGQAVGQLHDSVRADTLAMARALEQMRREGVFNFPYAAPLYQSRLGDFYFWENHRSLPLWRAIGDVNRELRGGRQ